MNFSALIAVVACLCALLAGPAWAQPAQPRAAETIEISAAMQAVTARFRGRIVSAELVPGAPFEASAAVYAFSLLTPAGDILRVRVDGLNGQILQVDGRGLVEARRSAERP